MKKLIIYFIAVLYFNNALCQQIQLSVEEQKNDLHFLEGKLKLIHPSLYRFCTKSQLDSTFSAIEAKIIKEQSVEEMGRLLSPIFLTIKGAHTWARLPKNNTQIRKLIPLEVKIISGKLFVYKNSSGESSIAEGAEIAEINKTSSKQILKELMGEVVVDGYIETTKERVVEEWFKHFYFDHFGYSDSFIYSETGPL